MPEPTVFSGRYELHRRLGRGGMAEVFLARDLQLDRPVAVKVLFPEFATDPSFVQRFRREAQAAANLNHPNIVGVYDWGQEHGTYFIVQEYVDGRSLSEILRAEGPLSPERAADIAVDVAGALGHAHKSGMLHRDIKPGNILVTGAGMVKVADWGIGRALDNAEENLTQTGAVMGTATYFSPEQAQGQSLDPRSDLYALGVVLYEMTTGRPPFSGDSPLAIAMKHVQEQPALPTSLNPAIPPELEAITLRLLEKQPSYRYASADDLRADLRRYREGFRVQAMAPRVAPAPPAEPATSVAPAVSQTRATAAYAEGAALAPEDDDAYYDDEPRERRSWIFVVVLILLLGVLAALLVVLANTLGIGDGGDDDPTVAQVAVPSVVNQPFDAAKTALEAEGFVVATPTFEQVSDPALVGVVLAQDPEGGIRVDEGSIVQLTVGAQDLLEVPNVAGSTIDVAANTIREVGFLNVPTTREEPSEDVEAGQVIRTEPAAGEQADRTVAIVLVVSSGPPPVPVPPCATLLESDCVDAVEAAGLVPQVSREPNNDTEAGRVVGTDPAQGTELPRGTTVRIIVSSGPTLAPSVVGRTQAEAEQAIRNAGLVPSVQFQVLDPGDPDVGKVIDQNPGGNEEVAPGSTVVLIVGQAAATTTTTGEDVGD